MKKIYVLLLFGLLSSQVWAQSSDLGNWFIYFGNQKINKKWNVWSEVQYRNYNVAGDLEQLLLRTGIGYNLSENNNNILLGYGFIHGEIYTDSIHKSGSNEHRIYQQFINRGQYGRVFVQHRYRLEERFLPNNVFKLRIRYFLSLNIPINKPKMEQNAIFLSLYNELFLGTRASVFDRTRVYAGIGWVINKNLRLETGLMYQLFETHHRPQWQIMFHNNIPFPQKAEMPEQSK